MMTKNKTNINKNATLRRSREQKTYARDKTHEQRKLKKKRKYGDEDINVVFCARCRANYLERGLGTSDKQVIKNTNRTYQKHKLEFDPYLSKLWGINRPGTLFRKIMQPRDKLSSPHILPPVPSTVRQKTNICYPLTGTSYTKPAMPTEDVSYPTQVCEQRASNTDEIVFSNGSSIRVEHDNRNQTANNSHAPGVRGTFASSARHQHQQQNILRNSVRNQSEERYVGKRPPKPPRYPEYTEFDQRLRSFARWWKQRPNPVALCEAGFFYTNKDDLVRCYHCGIGLKDFSYGDNPLNEHVKHSGDCLYLQDYLGPESFANIKRHVQTQDHRNNRQQESHITASNYRHPEYKSYEVRLSSFSGWPTSLMQTPHQLAEAGLYYTGFEDNVRCFACDGGLRKWDPEDDPWMEHCRWFPDCPFAKQQKGEEYIALVQSACASEIEDRLVNGTAPRNNTTSNDVTCEMERLTLRDPELNAVISEHRATCLEMGYSENEFNLATKSLAKRGNVRPTIEDILDAIEAEKQIKMSAAPVKNETPVEENNRLRRMIYCAKCKENAVNALFLPCTHHRLCLDCAESLTQCPFCDRNIRQKIKTYLV